MKYSYKRPHFFYQVKKKDQWFLQYVTPASFSQNQRRTTRSLITHHMVILDSHYVKKKNEFNQI